MASNTANGTNGANRVHASLSNRELASLAQAVQHAAPSTGGTFLSKHDEVVLEATQECVKIAAALANMPHETTAAVMLDNLRESLNTAIARHHWMTTAHTLKELGAKNIRLDADRGDKIRELSNTVDGAFKAIIRATELGDDEIFGLWTQIREIVGPIEDLSSEQGILSALHFWTMDRRKELIPKEHENTFSWILDDGGSNFSSWLGSNEPMYWISGKPGSGKSTVVKYVAESPKTAELLRPWTGGHKLVTAGFYFWSSATDELQKSAAGLLRSIMFQILRRCPDLSQSAFPSQWRRPRWEPTVGELLEGYKRVLALLPGVDTKFCFFIDGLDEFDGDPTDVISLVKGLVDANNCVKMCLSSRPWTAFEDIFGRDNTWKLYIHELTKGDMELYVRNQLASRGAHVNASLVDMIVDKARGVFLWVFLVVRDLQRIDEAHIHQRLDDTPDELDGYFEKMIHDTPASTREQTAKTFQVALSAVEKLPLSQYSIIIQPDEEAEAAAEQLETCSSGLLRPLDAAPHRVDFIHRTVSDFFRSDEMHLVLREWSDFDVHRAISASSLAMLRSQPPCFPADETRFLSSMHVLMAHAALTDAQADILDATGAWLSQHHEVPAMALLGPGNYWAHEASGSFVFLYHCVSYGLGTYVAQRIQGATFNETPSGLLSGCFAWDPRVRTGLHRPPMDGLKPLLEIGLDCNLPWGDRGTSFWQQLLTSAYSRHLKGVLDEDGRRAVRLAVRHGADMDATMELFAGRLGGLKAKEVVDTVLESH